MENYITRRGCHKRAMEVAKHSSLHSSAKGKKLNGDRRRYAGDRTHDYSNVYGWNLKVKQNNSVVK